MKNYRGTLLTIRPESIHVDRKIPEPALRQMMMRLSNGDWGDITPKTEESNSTIIKHGDYRRMARAIYQVEGKPYEVSVELENDEIDGEQCLSARLVNISCMATNEEAKKAVATG